MQTCARDSKRRGDARHGADEETDLSFSLSIYSFFLTSPSAAHLERILFVILIPFTSLLPSPSLFFFLLACSYSLADPTFPPYTHWPPRYTINIHPYCNSVDFTVTLVGVTPLPPRSFFIFLIPKCNPPPPPLLFFSPRLLL